MSQSKSAPSVCGFTLVELLVTVAIIGLLTSMAIVRTRNMVSRARAARIVSDFHVVREAAYQYYADNGRFPVSDVVGEEPDGLEPYLDGRLDWDQRDSSYQWLRWAPAGTTAAGPQSGELVWFTVKTSSFQVNRSVARIYHGPVMYLPGNRMNFLIQNDLGSR